MARVAAAMNTPGLKYRSFGNLPVRTEPARGDGAPIGPEEVLRELRAVSASLRSEESAPPADPASAMVPNAMAPITAVPPIDGKTLPPAPQPAPRPRAVSPPPSLAPAPRPPSEGAAPLRGPAFAPPPRLGEPTLSAPPPAPEALAPLRAVPPPDPNPTLPAASKLVMASPPVPAPLPPSMPVAPSPVAPAMAVRSAPASVISAAPMPQQAAAKPCPPVSVVMSAPPVSVTPPPAPAAPIAARAPVLAPVLAVVPPPLPAAPRAAAAPTVTPRLAERAAVAPPPPVMVAPPAALSPGYQAAEPPRHQAAEPPRQARGLAPVPEAAPACVVSAVLEKIDWSALSAPPRTPAPRPAEPEALRPALAPILAPSLAPSLPPSLPPLPSPAPPATSVAPPPALAGAELSLFAQASAALNEEYVPAAPAAVVSFPSIAPTPLLAPTPAPMPGPATDFVIFNNLGPPREAAPPGPAAPAGSTLSRLKQVVTSPGAPGLPAPLSRQDPPPRPGGNAMPASAVTVPLGEVMRLIAAGGPPAASPFDTFGAALRAPSSF